MQLNEEFLHYIWRFRLLNKRMLCCSNGAVLQVIHPGTLNTNAGPDFSFAQLCVGGDTWLGNIEIHVRASDWLLHRHHLDPSYDTVILHVVYEDDFAIYRTDGTLIPVLSLKGLLPELQLATYAGLLEARSAFPCARQIGTIGHGVISAMLERMIRARFEEKSAMVAEKSLLNQSHWNETFYYLLLRNFGFKVNAVPFELLADALPARLILRHRDNPLQIEAFLFGQAGFLEDNFTDAYPLQLKAEYFFLKKKYALQPLSKSVWHYLRMRPQNFPARRIAQLAALLSGKHHFLPQILENMPLKELKSLFRPQEVNIYWETHHHFDRAVKKNVLKFGERSVDNLIINTVCLALYSYGQAFGQQKYMDRAMTLLKEIPAERNSILNEYVKNGLRINSAYFSQAVLQLNKSYCNQKKCLNCNIGIKILNK